MRYNSQSEQKVYSALKALNDDWHILHSVPWQGARGNRAADGEADFVLIHKDHGVVVIEVKGGGVSLMNGRWVSEDRHGREHKIKNPFEQAAASKSNLYKWLKDRTGLFVPTCHVVAFPDIKCSRELGPASPTEIVWDRQALDSVDKAISRALSHWRQSGKANLSPKDVKRVIALFGAHAFG